MNVRKIVVILKKYFSIVRDREDKTQVIESVKKDTSFRGPNLWVLIFAIFLASLGLNVNSTAVIIGAMLISPLMGPIVGMGFGIGIHDFELFKRSFKNYFIATIISVITATVYFFISPLSEAQSELLARTSPTLYDVLIALFGGAAGVVAICTKGKGNVIPGVAIATALMPPLCTAGFGLATGNVSYFFGAFYLFFINTVFIALSTYLGVRLMKFEQKVFIDKERGKRVGRYMIIIIFVTMIPATFMTINIIDKSLFKNNVQNFINKEIKQSGTQILSFDINKKDSVLSIIAVGREIADTSIVSAQKKMTFYKMDKYKLQVIQGTNSEAVIGEGNIDYRTMLQQEEKLIQELKDSLNSYKTYDDISTMIKDEIKVLYPNISTISIMKTNEIEVNNNIENTKIYAIVSVKDKKLFETKEKENLLNWLKVRCKTKDINLVVK
ncbi:MAG: TIGR00341 family protein [Bacteroidales bacterium]|nr:TIGR00341 family protein [Bacteroidales bacterium]